MKFSFFITFTLFALLNSNIGFGQTTNWENITLSQYNGHTITLGEIVKTDQLPKLFIYFSPSCPPCDKIYTESFLSFIAHLEGDVHFVAKLSPKNHSTKEEFNNIYKFPNSKLLFDEKGELLRLFSSSPRWPLIATLKRDGEKSVLKTKQLWDLKKAKQLQSKITKMLQSDHNGAAATEASTTKIKSPSLFPDFFDNNDDEKPIQVIENNDAIVFTLEAPKTATVGEKIRISYTINRDIKNLDIKSFPGFTLLGGPYTSSSMQMNTEQGKTIIKKEYTYSYILMPQNAGISIIPKASAIIDGKTFYSNCANMHIISASSKESITNPAISIQTIPDDNLFLELSVSQNEAFIQEPILATIKLYSKENISGLNKFKEPDLNQFLKYNLPISSRVIFKKEQINGQVYNSAKLREILLYPQLSGEHNVQGAELECSIRVQDKQKRKSFFDDFFENNFQTIKKTIKTKDETIIIKNFPDKKPKDFAYLCGTNLKLTGKIETSRIKLNSPFTYEITLSGNGNLKFVEAPELKLPKGIKLMDVQAQNDLGYSSEGISGSRTFIYTIVPEQSGSYIIPPTSLSYFNVSMEKYESISIPSTLFNVNTTDASHEIIHFQENTLKFDKVGIPKDRSNTIIVLDISSSMLAQDILPNRMDATIAAANDFLISQREASGLVLFAKHGKAQCSLTTNINNLQDSLKVAPETNLIDGTAIGMGLSVAISMLKDEKAERKNIILLSNGDNNSGSITEKNGC